MLFEVHKTPPKEPAFTALQQEKLDKNAAHNLLTDEQILDELITYGFL